MGSDKSVELYTYEQGHECFLPDLPTSIHDPTFGGHSLDDNLLCFGSNTWLFENGQWIQKEFGVIDPPRAGHVSWKIDDGVILIGGNVPSAKKSAVLINLDGTLNSHIDLDIHLDV